ncbi:PH domain-containing protein [Anaerocolumna xylanovorans]|uniref:PH domain-containing protein n=1 Tax=Anaerocolumna xylanovorans DSM 12503 TaxID=1121345 RepID=A0A1M7Y3U8_9FIRM|nr:PH domain-containing protein [Anaerocolumna xylanovorans]SHO46739.1 PH domain-containing protein [Anaerocolumna xylanovorans DSM 12503]
MIDYTSIPYSKIQTYSIETSGHFDLDAKLDTIWDILFQKTY